MKKLLVTLGPASLSPDIIKAMSAYSPYVFRLNMSHVSLEDLPRSIRLIQEATDVPVCIDSEGAQVRTHSMQGGQCIFAENDEIEIHSDLREGTSKALSITPAGITAELREGDILRPDWHGVAVRVIRAGNGTVTGKVECGGAVASRKGIDVSRSLPLAAITPKDREAIRIGREMNVRHYALSFAGSADQVREFRALTGPEARIISKLESMDALKNLVDVLNETDEALIDRGDLSRVVPLAKIPFLQMRILATARALDTPVYVATNLLESMIDNGFPTRAEANDVVSSILMGASGLVLAAESAMGKHPVSCVETVRTLMDLCRKWTANTTIDEILMM
ncbi:pyruvate kinase [Desulfovibrio sp. OttesenSCG-928-I05]|nr:pyruvate kinase [Desulfovibrio sp. OttesenSCG-928-I05]